MNTKDLCLCALQLGDASGYDIKALFERAFRHFQRASFGSIYPALNELAKAGLVECRTETQDGRPDKKTYSLTGSGERCFLDIISTTAPTESFQSDFLVLVLFSRWIKPERLKTVLNEYRQGLQQQLTDLDNLLAEDTQRLSHEALFTIHYGRHTLAASMAFVDQHSSELLNRHRSARQLSHEQ